jgi:hypothetical protein
MSKKARKITHRSGRILSCKDERICTPRTRRLCPCLEFMRHEQLPNCIRRFDSLRPLQRCFSYNACTNPFIVATWPSLTIQVLDPLERRISRPMGSQWPSGLHGNDYPVLHVLIDRTPKDSLLHRVRADVSSERCRRCCNHAIFALVTPCAVAVDRERDRRGGSTSCRISGSTRRWRKPCGSVQPTSSGC